MGYASHTSKTLLTAIAVFTCSSVLAAPVNYELTFEQTWLAHDPATSGYGWLGPRLLTGQLTIDDSVLGPLHANTTYDRYSPELQAINSYTVTLDSKVYSFKPDYEGTLIRTDANGDIVDLQGEFYLPGTFTRVILGSEGYAGTYLDQQQTDPFSSANVSSGTFTIALVSSVPEPTTALMFGFGLIGLSAVVRRRKVFANG